MTPRERVITALNRSVPDKVPKYFEVTPPVLETFKRITGAEDPAEYSDLEIRRVSFAPTRLERLRVSPRILRTFPSYAESLDLEAAL